MIDDEIHLIPAKRRDLSRHHLYWRLPFAGTHEILGVLDHILLHRFDIVQHLGQVRVAVLQLRHVMTHSKQRHLAVQLPEVLALFLAPAHDVANDMLELALQLGDGRLRACQRVPKRKCLATRWQDEVSGEELVEVLI